MSYKNKRLLRLLWLMALLDNGFQQGGPLGMFVGQVRSMDATNI